MVLENHIAYRFLTDDKLWFEILESTHPEEFKKAYRTEKTEDLQLPDQVHSLYHLLHSKDQKAYYVTNTVLEKLDMLKIKPTEAGHYDWTVFSDIQDQKLTFICPDNFLLRVRFHEDTVSFIHTEFKIEDKKKGTGKMKWVMFYLNRKTGELCEHFGHSDVKTIEKFYYALFCFMFLTENDEIIVAPGTKHGSKKYPDNLLNCSRFPITIVNSRWNTTSIRNEGFDVSGHFRLQPCGENFSKTKIIFIEPFKKEGYVRRAQKETQPNNI